MNSILTTQGTLSIQTAMMYARDALVLTEFANGESHNEALEAADEYLNALLKELSEFVGEDWKTARWMSNTPAKSILKVRKREKEYGIE